MVFDTETELITALQQGEKRACADLVRRFSPQVYRIALRLIKKRLPTISLDDPVELDDDYAPRQLGDWSLDPHRLVLTDELRQVMDAGVAQLSDALRAVFVMRELEELTTAETAALLGITESAVKVRLHRARLQLREHLDGYLAGDGSEDAKR